MDFAVVFKRTTPVISKLSQEECHPRTNRHHLPINVKINNDKADVNINSTNNHQGHQELLASSQDLDVLVDACDVGDSCILSTSRTSQSDKDSIDVNFSHHGSPTMRAKSPALSTKSNVRVSQDNLDFRMSPRVLASRKSLNDSPQLSLDSYERRVRTRNRSSSSSFSTVTDESSMDRHSSASSSISLPDVEMVSAHLKKLRLSSELYQTSANDLITLPIDANEASFRTATTLASNASVARFHYAVIRDPLLSEPLVPFRSANLFTSDDFEKCRYSTDDISLPTPTAHRTATALIHQARIALFRGVEPHCKSKLGRSVDVFRRVSNPFHSFNNVCFSRRRKYVFGGMDESDQNLGRNMLVLRWSACSKVGSRTVAMFNHALTAWSCALEERVQFVYTEERDSIDMILKTGYTTRGYYSLISSMTVIRVVRGRTDYFSLLNEIGHILGL